MSIRLDRVSCPVHLSKSLSDRADQYVQQGAGGRSSADTHPFRRKIDFWIMSVAYAVFLGVPAASEAPKDVFVRVSSNPREGPSLPEDVQTALVALHIAEHEDMDLDELDLAPAAILSTADRYAETGASVLLRRLQEHLRDMDVLAYQGMAEMLRNDHASCEDDLMAIES